MLWTYFQHNFAGGRLDKELMGRQDLKQYYNGLSELRNFTVRRQGNLSKRRGTDIICDLRNGSIKVLRVVPIVFSKDEGYYLLFTQDHIYIASKDGIRFSNGTAFTKHPGSMSLYSIPSGMNESQTKTFDYVQSGDTIFCVHNELPPFQIVFYRYFTKDEYGTHDACTISRRDIPFAEVVHEPPVIKDAVKENLDSARGATKTVNYKATYVGTDGIESFVSEPVSVTYKTPWSEGGTITVKVYSNGQEKPEQYNLYKNDGSGFGYIGTIKADNISDKTIDDVTYQNYGEFIDDYYTPDLTLTPPVIEKRRTFSEEGDYPSVVSLYQQRLVLGASKNDPFTFWMSCTGDLYNFSTHETVREDDAITATLAATEQPEINHALLARELMFFANSGEWTVAPTSGNSISYKTVSAKMQSAIGSSRGSKPFVVGENVIFLDSTGERVLATKYNYVSDGYDSQDLTVLSQWMFRDNAVKRMTYRQTPDSTIHCVMSNGSIAVLVYMKEQEVLAWARYDLSGGFKAIDVASARCSSRGSTEIVYLVQNEESGGYELWRERDDLPIRTDNAIRDYVCMDRCDDLKSGNTVPKGMMAVGLTTAKVFNENDTVTEDSLVGYPFESKLETVHPDTKQENESLQIEIVNATEAKVRVIDSSSFTIGACSSSESQDSTVDIPVVGENGKVILQDKDAKVILYGSNNRDGRVRITHNGVFPLNILSIAITYQVELENQNAVQQS